ncbi:peptidylprolyl isomerase [Halopseudomonas laoshanensis]|uniref:Peptidyl-prolyl cis-trans isomerase n=1 Tax=Halopseudomonas laoshanensis TaxID=2268758 RepID=A0A7V7GUY3_9GAMM|nr:peptidylprolyl isomerase [Halopseudomonas laoshanensis]KAA0695045.1 peptidylprolyl isomerase [Halopseudomonas laoshanensis]
MQIAANKAVSIEYTLTNDAGEVLDSSAGGGPLVYLHGAGNIIPGLEQALDGKQVGDELKVSVEPENAYGEFSAELVAVLGRNMFEGVDELEVGMQFHASGPDGGMQIVTITAVEGDEVTVDGNHPLAGQRLTFEVKVAGVREATEDELAHGHIHGEGGVEH